MVVIRGFEQSAKERPDAHDLEVVPAHFACPDRPGHADTQLPERRADGYCEGSQEPAEQVILKLPSPVLPKVCR